MFTSPESLPTGGMNRMKSRIDENLARTNAETMKDEGRIQSSIKRWISDQLSDQYSGSCRGEEHLQIEERQ